MFERVEELKESKSNNKLRSLMTYYDYLNMCVGIKMTGKLENDS